MGCLLWAWSVFYLWNSQLYTILYIYISSMTMPQWDHGAISIRSFYSLFKFDRQSTVLAIGLQQIFAHDMTAQLSCHVQNFVAMGSLEFGSEQMKIHQIWIVLEKCFSEIGPWSCQLCCEAFTYYSTMEGTVFILIFISPPYCPSALLMLQVYKMAFAAVPLRWDLSPRMHANCGIMQPCMGTLIHLIAAWIWRQGEALQTWQKLLTTDAINW